MQHLAYEGPWDVSETIVEKHNALRASTNYSVRVCYLVCVMRVRLGHLASGNFGSDELKITAICRKDFSSYLTRPSSRASARWRRIRRRRVVELIKAHASDASVSSSSVSSTGHGDATESRSAVSRSLESVRRKSREGRGERRRVGESESERE
eukprot:6035881-Pleurochrysis_carterae.AAC.1